MARRIRAAANEHFRALHCPQRPVVERTFCRLKDWRRVATRYDQLARNFLAGVLLASIVSYWL